MNNGDIVKRNGNYFEVKKDKHRHYYLALLLGKARVSAWHRTPLKKIQTLYERTNDYEQPKHM